MVLFNDTLIKDCNENGKYYVLCNIVTELENFKKVALDNHCVVNLKVTTIKRGKNCYELELDMTTAYREYGKHKIENTINRIVARNVDTLLEDLKRLLMNKRTYYKTCNIPF